MRTMRDVPSEALFGNVAEHLVNQVAMRVEHCDPFAILYVLDDEIEEKRRFPGSRGSDDVSVLRSLIRAERHNGSLSRVVILAQHEAMATH